MYSDDDPELGPWAWVFTAAVIVTTLALFYFADAIVAWWL